jgi:riboflavin kinase/FMN adenylyltransferase
MLVFRKIEALQGVLEGRRTVVSWGVFDGVHRGHQAILLELRSRATERTPSLLVVFDWHPDRILKGNSPPCLTPPPLRDRLISEAGIDYLLEFPFDQTLADTPAERFLAETIHKRLRAQTTVLGSGSRFGAGGREAFDVLRREGPPLGIEAVEVPPVKVEGEIPRSTLIRRKLTEGKVREAAKLLGRPHILCGRVMEGDRRGRVLGFPTANLDTGIQLLPLNGVYAGRCRLEEGTFASMLNIGVHPTFTSPSPASPLCEVHLIGFTGDLYGRTLEVDIIERLREERRFPSPAELKSQLERDRAQVQRLQGDIPQEPA